MSTQAAVVLADAGKPLQKVSIPIPTPKENEVLVKITVSGLNPMDPKLRDIQPLRDMFHMSAGSPLAFDIVGTVVSNGPNSSLPVGSRIYAQAPGGQSCGTQEYTTLNETWCIPVPSNISDTDASTLPINGFTTGVSVFEKSLLNIPLPGTPEADAFDYAGTAFVIVGAGTNNGKLAIQFARLAGVGKIIAIASLSSEDELKKLGATHVVDRRADDINAKVRAIAGDEVLHVFDTFNQDTSLAVSILSNSTKGTLVHLVPQGQPSEEAKAEKAKTVGWEDKTVFGSPDRYADFAKVFWKKTFVEWLQSGKLSVPTYEVINGLDAEKINKALDDVRDGKSRAKWAIVL